MHVKSAFKNELTIYQQQKKITYLIICILVTPLCVLWQTVKSHNTAFHQGLHCLLRQEQSSDFPHSWKEANVSPIFKKDDRSLPSNYRPISLLCQAGKVMERCIHKHLYNYVLSNHILTPLQSGFVSGDPTTFQLLHTYHMFCEAVDNGKEVRVVFCDISKAFDRV